MMNTYTREDIYNLLIGINQKAIHEYGSGYGLPLYTPADEGFTDLVITKLGLTVMEDERILTIQKHTGCTRAQAQSLMDSGDLS